MQAKVRCTELGIVHEIVSSTKVEEVGGKIRVVIVSNISIHIFSVGLVSNSRLLEVCKYFHESRAKISKLWI